MSVRADQQAVVVEPQGFDAPHGYLFVLDGDGIIARASILESEVPLP